MKIAVHLPAVLLMLALVSGTWAADPPKSKTEKVRGRVTKVENSGGKITISDYVDGQEKEIVVTTDDKTKVTVDGKDAKVKDIAVGMRVNADVTDGVATTLSARKAASAGQSGCIPPSRSPTRSS